MTITGGIDVGGTAIKSGRVREGEVLDERACPTGAANGVAHVLAQIVETARALCAAGDVAAIGIGMPGLVARDRDTVRNPPNFPGWTEVALAAHVREAVGAPVVVDNDANCAALAEARYGAGRDVRDFLLVTLGTGVGGGVILDGDVYRGETGGAGEIGHTTIDYQGPECNCGSRGCVETYVGNAYFVARVGAALVARRDSSLHAVVARGEPLTPARIAEAAAQGDAFAREQFYDAGYHLGVALANAMALLDISTAILGGGVAQAGEPLFAGVRRALGRYSQKPMSARCAVRAAALGNRAGVLGAATLARDQLCGGGGTSVHSLGTP